MLLSELLEETGLTQADASRILGKSSVAISRRCTRPSEVKVSELLKFEEEVGRILIKEHVDKVCDKNRNEQVEIPYYNNPNLKTNIKSPLVTSIWFDRELVENDWKKVPENLRIIKMLGDKMQGSSYSLNNGDMLILDISETDVISSGVYVYTMRNGEDIFINGVSKGMDGVYKFFCTNENYKTKFFTSDELKAMGFEVVGRIVKNLSLII